MTLVMLVLTCGMAIPVQQCTPETALTTVERPVSDPLICAGSAGLPWQTSAQVTNAGTYDKSMCRSVHTRWRPGIKHYVED